MQSHLTEKVEEGERDLEDRDWIVDVYSRNAVQARNRARNSSKRVRDLLEQVASLKVELDDTQDEYQDQITFGQKQIRVISHLKRALIQLGVPMPLYDRMRKDAFSGSPQLSIRRDETTGEVVPLLSESESEIDNNGDSDLEVTDGRFEVSGMDEEEEATNQPA